MMAKVDVTLEAGGRNLTAAVLEAVLVELPLAAICFWIARDAERVLVHTLPAWRRAAIRAVGEPGAPD